MSRSSGFHPTPSPGARGASWPRRDPSKWSSGYESWVGFWSCVAYPFRASPAEGVRGHVKVLAGGRELVGSAASDKQASRATHLGCLTSKKRAMTRTAPARNVRRRMSGNKATTSRLRCTRWGWGCRGTAPPRAGDVADPGARSVRASRCGRTFGLLVDVMTRLTDLHRLASANDVMPEPDGNGSTDGCTGHTPNSGRVLNPNSWSAGQGTWRELHGVVPVC